MTFRSLFDVTQNPGWISSHDGVGGDIFSDDAAGAHNRIFADVGVGENRGAGADGCTLSYDRPFDLPVSFCLQVSLGSRGPRIGIVDERHSVPDEDVVLDDDAFAYKSMAGDLATFAHGNIFLDFHECADLCLVPDLASVEIDEF